jgi:hypothetical protein
MDDAAPMDVDVDALVHQSLAIRAEAARLLRDLGLVEQLRPYGEVVEAGSYRWDLMTRGDLDFYVINPRADLELALDAFTHLVRRGDFLRFGFIDSARAMPPWHVPEGYYLGMEREFGERTWRVQVWLLRAALPRPDWIVERMTPEKRRRILHLKHLRESGHLAVASYDIYRAVLLGDVEDPAGVRAWLAAETG